MTRGIWMALWLTGGCGSSDGETDGETADGPWPASCDSSETTGDQRGLCRLWSGEKTADDDAFRGQCEEEYEGVYGDEGCPGDAVVGICETDQGYGLFLDYTYYSPTYTAQTAQLDCESLPSCSFSCEWVAVRAL